MKGSEFVNLMRKVIREEVRAIVKEELKAFKPVIVESKTVTNYEAPKAKETAYRPQLPKPTKKAPVVTIDGVLGELLNETAQSMYNDPNWSAEQEEWPDMNNGPVTMDNMPGMMGMRMQQPQKASVDFTGDPTAVFMKDYSQILKQANAIADGNRG
jgi:hypothetical protein